MPGFLISATFAKCQKYGSTATMESSKEDIISNLRAIIISSKGGLKLSDVRADYKEAFGVDIPLKSLGYTLLEDFFKSNPQDFKIIGNTIQAVMKPSSVHIVSLVSRQNSKKRGRPKLFSKQARNLRKPTTLNDSGTGMHGRKYAYSTPPRFSRQGGPRENVSSACWQMHEVKAPENIQKPAQALDKSSEEKCVPIVQTQRRSLEDLKSIRKTVVKELNPVLPASNLKQIKEGKTVSFSEEIPFEDFEDLNLSKRPQSRLLKIKPPLEKKLVLSNSESSEDQGESAGSPPPSPFTRSLANTTKEEILLAKRTAQTRIDNNNLPSKPRHLADITVDLDEDTKYEQKLKQFCIDKGLIMPIYSVLVREPLNQPKCYGCKLSIGDTLNVSTYPVETHSETTARELASKKAYNLLTLNNNLPTPVLDTEYVVKLRTLCSQKNLPDPIFKSIECRPKNEPGYYICKVRIGDSVLLSSYPEEVHDELTARDLAAKKAYKYLFSDSTSPSAAVSKSEKVTLNQIFNILKTKEYGVWSNKLQSLYVDTYNEILPSNWFDLVKNCSKFEINHIERAGFIIRAKTDAQIAEESAESTILATLKVPESNQWEVYVTNVVTSAEIWCRLIGKDYSEVYDSMMTKLELQPPTLNVKKPVVGEVYLINLEESWNRVRVKEIFPEKQEASVFLIDIGVDEIVELSQLFYLQKTFFSVAPQAILLSLNELDSLAECEELQSPLFHSLLGNTFIAEVVAILDEGGNVCSVNLWDTSTEEDINMNLRLIDDVIRTIKGPILPSVGLVREMFVSYVEDNGDIYLQTSKKNMQFVDKIISIKFKNSGKLVSAGNQIDPKRLYTVCCNKSGLYYRVKLIKLLEGNLVLVKFIDFGYEQQVAIEDLFDLEQTSLDLATIPSQVVRTSLSGLKVFNTKVLSKIRECVLEQNVLVKVTQVNAGCPPSVELFQRSHADGTLSSVNNKILDNGEFLNVENPVRKKSYVVGLESTMSRDLPMPNIPPIGSYFNVIVTLAAHPNLFSVQPLATQNELLKLMFRLQEKCEKAFSRPLAEEEFEIGNLYAVKYTDGYWYRAYAHATVSPSSFTVCLCDFGDLVVVPAEKLMPLSSEFKTFPYQAIRAYLAGIEPVNKDWTPLDCVKFKEMVVEKQFVSQVVEINRDLKNPNYITLGLILVDTTTSEDIYIHQKQKITYGTVLLMFEFLDSSSRIAEVLVLVFLSMTMLNGGENIPVLYQSRLHDSLLFSIASFAYEIIC